MKEGVLNEKVEEIREEVKVGGIFEIDGEIGIRDSLIYAFQHIIAMCTGVLALPLIVGNVLGVDKEILQYLVAAAFMVAGIGTIIQSSGIIKGVGIKLLAMEGANFIGMMSLVSIATRYKGEPITGMKVMFGATIVVGILTLLVAPFFRKILKFFPFLVSGIIVTLLGLSLMPMAISWIGGGLEAGESFGNFRNLGLAAFTFLVVILIQKYGKGTFGNLAILFGILIGTIVGAFFGFTNFKNVTQASILSVNKPFMFGLPKFEFSSIISLTLVQIAILVEGMGNQTTLTNASGQEVNAKGLISGLRGHGASTILAGIFNSFPQGIFAQNAGLVGMTKVSNRKIGTTAGILLIVISLFPKVISLITAIPAPVLGGAAIVMFGAIVANGIKMIGCVCCEDNHNVIVVAASITLGLIPVMNPAILNYVKGDIRMMIENAVIMGGATAIILNVHFHGVKDAEE